jgi:hypothetical protein
MSKDQNELRVLVFWSAIKRRDDCSDCEGN